MSQTFLATLPFSILAINPRFDAGGCWILDRLSRVEAESAGEKIIALIFTDDDLADRYAAAAGNAAEPVFIDDAEAAAAVVERLIQFHRVTHVAFDPVFGRRVRQLETVAEFLESLTRGDRSGQ